DDPHAEQEDRGDQVDEGGHRLQEVQNRPHDGRDGLRSGGPDADRYRDDHGDDHRHQGECDRLHRVGPLSDRADEQQPDDGADRELVAFRKPGDRRDGDDDDPERRGEEQPRDAGVQPAEDRGDHVEEAAEGVDHPVDQVGDPLTERDADRVVAAHQLCAPSVEVDSSTSYSSAISSAAEGTIGISRVVAGPLPSAASSVTRGITPTRRWSASTTGSAWAEPMASSTMSVSRSSGRTNRVFSTIARRSVPPAFTARMTARSVTTPTRRRPSTANTALA